MFTRLTAAAAACVWDTIPQARPRAWVSTGVLHCEVWTPGLSTESWGLSHTTHLASGEAQMTAMAP